MAGSAIRVRAVASIVLVLLISAPLLGADGEDPKIVSLFWENDQRLWREFALAPRGWFLSNPCDDRTLAPPSSQRAAALENECRERQSDKYYTNGLKVAVLHIGADSDEANCFFRPLVRALQTMPPFLFSRKGHWAAGWVAGQSLFTPREEKIESPVFDPSDRPFGAWSYLGVTAVGQTQRWQQTLELDIGVTGKEAGGREIQTGAHWLINVFGAHAAAHPIWKPQVPSGVRGQLVYQAKWQPGDLSLGFTHAGLTLHGGGAYGNVVRFLNGGALLRLGQGLPADFGPGGPGLPPVGNVLTGRGMEPDQAWMRDLGGSTIRPAPGYLFVGFDARYIDYNLLLGKPSELGGRHRDFVWDLVSGVALPAFLIGRRDYTVDQPTGRVAVTESRGLCLPALTWRLVRRSREFEGQQLFGQPKAFWFGSFNLVWAPDACSEEE
jgi:hypothetical protein